MHITLNGDAREFPWTPRWSSCWTRWAMPASAWRWNATARSCPRASTRKPRWPTATRSRSWWRWAGLNARRRADPASPLPTRQPWLRRNAAGRSCVKVGGREPGSLHGSFPPGVAAGRATPQQDDPGTTKREPQSIPSLPPRRSSARIRQPRHARRADIWRTLVRPTSIPDRNRHTALHRPDERHPPGRQPDQPQYLLGHRAAPAHRAGRAPQPGRPSADPAVRRGRHPGRLWQNPVDIRAGSIGLLISDRR